MTDTSSGDEDSGDEDVPGISLLCHFCKQRTVPASEGRVVAIDGENSFCCYSCVYTRVGRKQLARIIPRDDGAVWLLLYRTVTKKDPKGSELPVAHRLDPSEIFHCTDEQVNAMIWGFRRIVLAVYGTGVTNPAGRYRDAKRRGYSLSVADALTGDVSGWLSLTYEKLVHDDASFGGREEYVTREDVTRRVTSRRIQRDARAEELELEVVRVATGAPSEIAELVCSYVAPLVSAAKKAMEAAKAVYDKKLENFQAANDELSEQNRADDMAANDRRWKARARRAQSALAQVGAKRKEMAAPPPDDSDYDSYSDMELARATKRAAVARVSSSSSNIEDETEEETEESNPPPKKTAARVARRAVVPRDSSSI